MAKNQNNISFSIGQQIKIRRKELGVTQPDVAELAGISTNTLYKIETGQTSPTIKVVQKIAEVLGMELRLRIKPTGLSK